MKTNIGALIVGVMLTVAQGSFGWSYSNGKGTVFGNATGAAGIGPKGSFVATPTAGYAIGPNGSLVYNSLGVAYLNKNGNGYIVTATAGCVKYGASLVCW